MFMFVRSEIPMKTIWLWECVFVFSQAVIWIWVSCFILKFPSVTGKDFERLTTSPSSSCSYDYFTLSKKIMKEGKFFKKWREKKIIVNTMQNFAWNSREEVALFDLVLPVMEIYNAHIKIACTWKSKSKFGGSRTCVVKNWL